MNRTEITKNRAEQKVLKGAEPNKVLKGTEPKYLEKKYKTIFENWEGHKNFSGYSWGSNSGYSCSEQFILLLLSFL